MKNNIFEAILRIYSKLIYINYTILIISNSVRYLTGLILKKC